MARKRGAKDAPTNNGGGGNAHKRGKAVTAPGVAACALVSGVCGVACHMNALHGDFVFDDIPAVVGNNDANQGLSWDVVTRIPANNFWGEHMGRASSQHESYRPITTLSFAANSHLGGLDPFGFHLTNVLLHAVVTALVVVVCARVVRPSGVLPLLACGLAFAVHPVHVDAVVSIVGRCELLSCLFFLLSFLSYARACAEEHRTGWGWVAGTLVCTFCAVLCKEQGVTAIAVCAAYDLAATFELRPTGVWARRTAALAVGLVCIMGNRLYIMHGDVVVFDWQTNPADASADALTRVLSKIHYNFLHFWLLVWPKTLCCDWSGSSVALVTSVWDPRNAGAAALALLVLTVGLHSLQRKQGAVLVGCAFLFAPFLPASGWVMNVGFVVAERVMYMPSVGFVLLVAELVHRLPVRLRVPRLVVWGVVGLWVCLLAGRTWTRNPDWDSTVTLYRSGVEALPSNAKMHHNYANVLDKSQAVLKEIHFRTAIDLHPRYHAAWTHLGALLYNQGRKTELVALLQQGVDATRGHENVKGDRAMLVRNLISVLNELGRHGEANEVRRREGF